MTRVTRTLTLRVAAGARPLLIGNATLGVRDLIDDAPWYHWAVDLAGVGTSRSPSGQPKVMPHEASRDVEGDAATGSASGV